MFYRASSGASGCPWLPVYPPCCGSFFYSLNIPKMVDFRGFKHPDVPEEGRGGGNKHRGVQKSTHRGWGPKYKKMFYSLTLRQSRLLPPLTRLGGRFFYSLNIPKMVDYRGFKHSDVPEGARGGVNKHRGVQKSKKIFIALRAEPAARGCPFTRTAVDRFFYSLNIPKMVDFRGFKHPDVPEGGRGDVPEGARGGVNKHRGVQKSTKFFLSRFERGRLPVAARLPALL
ncbi:hypothetical protein ACOMHN_038786 [Nucella lapillus]